MSPPALPRDRRELEASTHTVLSRGGARNADVLRVRTDEGFVIAKDYGPRSGWVHRWLGPWLVRRELAAYRALEGHPNVPRVLGVLDPLCLLLEERRGELLSRSLRGRLPEGFLAELELAIAAMHAAGVVHLDLRHRSNLLAGEDGRPVLLDFASAIRLRKGSWSARLFGPGLRAIDRRALRKWQRKLG